MPEFARRCYPATLRLKELLATQLGPPRLIVGHSRLFGFDRYGVPGPTTQIAPAPLLIDPGSYLLDWCCFVFQSHARGAARVAVPGHPVGRTCADQESDFESFVATFPARRDGPDLVRPLSPGALGRRQPVPAAAGLPGLRRARGGLAGDARADPVVRRRPAPRRNGSRWSRRSATCSTTSSIAWSGAISRWRRRSARPWRSPGWSATCAAVSARARSSVRSNRVEDASRMGTEPERTCRAARHDEPRRRTAVLGSARRAGGARRAGLAGRRDCQQLGDLRRGGLPPRGRPLVADGRPGRDHPDGLAADVLEAPAGPGALGARPHRPGAIGSTIRSATSASSCRWSGSARSGSGWWRSG